MSLVAIAARLRMTSAFGPTGCLASTHPPNTDLMGSDAMAHGGLSEPGEGRLSWDLRVSGTGTVAA